MAGAVSSEGLDNPSVPNNGPRTNGFVWALTAITGIFLCLRFFCKSRKRRGLWWDDWLLVASWVCQVAGAILLSLSISQGFGKDFRHIDPELFDDIGLRGLFIGSLLMCGTAWSKTSFAITLSRIASPRLKIALWFIIASMNLFTLAATLVQWIQCVPMAKIWTPLLPGTCWSPMVNLGFSMGSSGYSALVDIILAFLPWTIIIKLQMKRSEKIGVAIAMSMGVFAGATAIVKCVKLELMESNDFTLEGGVLITWAVAEITTTIVAATIPVLRTLVREVGTNARAGAYIRSTSHDEINKKPQLRRTDRNMVTVSTSKPATIGRPFIGTDSDVWIFQGTTGAGIVKTDEVRVKYGKHSKNEDDLDFEV